MSPQVARKRTPIAGVGRAWRRPARQGTCAGGGTVPGNNVQRFREALMMSKAELARKAGLSTLTIDRIEAGRPCRLDTKRKILLALGLRDLATRTACSGSAPTHRRRPRCRAAGESRSKRGLQRRRSTCSFPSLRKVQVDRRSRHRLVVRQGGRAARSKPKRHRAAPPRRREAPAEAIVQGAFLNSSAITEAIREAIDNGRHQDARTSRPRCRATR